jgi:hypothetical protein
MTEYYNVTEISVTEPQTHRIARHFETPVLVLPVIFTPMSLPPVELWPWGRLSL